MDITVSVEKASNITRKLTVKVPAKTVSKHYEKGLAEVQRTAKIKGFRPGHVPMSVVKQYYGEDVRHRVFHNLIDESYREALRSEKIMAVGSPQIDTPDHKTGDGEHDHSLHEGKDLTFTATVEVMPDIDVKGYTGVALSQGNAEITDKDVETAIKGILDSQSQLDPITDEKHTAQKGEYADMTFDGGVVTDTGVEPKEGMKGNRVIEIGSDALIPGFEENMIGMKKGETKTFRVPFPKDFYEADLAGKDAEFTVTINELKTKTLPPLDDALAKTMGYDSVADLKKKANDHLTTERANEVDRKLRSDLLQQLIEKNTFDVPSSLVQAQTRALAQEVGNNLKNQGFTDQMIQEALVAELENLNKRAENQVRASLILEAIAKKETITVGPADIDTEMTTLSTNMKVDEARVREFYLKNPQRRDDLEFRMREDKTVKFLLEKAKIKKEK
ncbi:MAG: trigger factor [Methylotenera sp.]|nr:trigger factor [Oligoflexia bacterium]